MKMDAICCGKMEERSSSFRRVRRSNSTLVASELEASEAARVVAYSRLSQSMRVCDEPAAASSRYDKRRKNKALTFLKKVFSCTNTDATAIKEQTAEKAAEQKKRQPAVACTRMVKSTNSISRVSPYRSSSTSYNGH